MSEAAANGVFQIMEGGSVDGMMLLVYVCGAFISQFLIIPVAQDLVLGRARRVLAVVATTLLLVSLAHVGAGGFIRGFLLNDSRRIVELAKSDRLLAEPARDWGGNIIEGRVILRESTTETLFNRQVETSGWSKSVDVETARALSEYLEKENRGEIAWRGLAGK